MFYSILLYVTLIAGCTPLGLFLAGHKYNNQANRVVLPLVGLMTFSSAYEYVVSLKMGVSVVLWYLIYPAFEFATLYFLFENYITQRPKWLFHSLLGLFLLFYILSLCCFDTDSYLMSTGINKIYSTFFVLLCTFLWVRQVSNQKKILKLYNESQFFIVMGLFFYYVTTISVFTLLGFIDKSDLYIYDYWLVNIIASLILRITISIGVCKMI
ncbi:hypothetical protein [Myroides pelagicus]|uniref:Histidine kinase N-terminal 7TM region domain-containing protein n=1 Tax=Myroides pelagicus TaxID=270914 RepID=A0A7K1GP64_9FLAO|nr:hypothetical protein [Myroides pelagicus]MTH30349.1 hypothetical protein [Myroides pelagicus]